jgi:hypothetical protein
MPPYAGLDELYHVARLAFTAEEGRSPSTGELSIPPYLHKSILQRPDALPSFAEIGPRWPKVIEENPGIIRSEPLTPADLRPYAMRNYEAQHPPVYYALAAPLVRILDVRSAVSELRLWRLISVILGVLIVVVTARAGELMSGPAGILTGAFLIVMPTWFTLVARVGNDALACALIAAGFMITASDPRRVAGWLLEGLVWAAAVATKLYAWPIAVVAPLFWWKQRAGWKRAAVVITMSALAAIITLVELSSRTESAIGVVALNRPGTAPLEARVDAGELLRVFVASFAWTAGQHGNALRPIAIALYLGPVLLTFLWSTARTRGGPVSSPAAARERPVSATTIAAIALLTFALAQVLNVILSVMARRAGNDIPIGGKEGWYWYALAPVIAVLIIGPLIHTRPRVAMAILAWMVIWDLMIHESALFQDYAGATSAATPTSLFRWGPLHAPFTATLDGIGVGPLAGGLIVLRIAELLALVALVRFTATYSGTRSSA